jgi:hypothetical protein
MVRWSRRWRCLVSFFQFVHIAYGRFAAAAWVIMYPFFVL